jgi:hypothetical protein
MTHLAFERISALADAAGTDVAVAGTEGRHLQECAECREQLRTLRDMLSAAHALPHEIAPPPEAWEGIRARVAARPHARSRFTAGRWLVAAAAVVLLVGSAVLLPFNIGTNRPSRAKGAAVPQTPVAIAAVEQQYSGTVAELRQALDGQRPALGARVTGVVDKSLADIDAAISETRDALRIDPENAALVDILSSHYERKVDLLQRATELATSD